MLIPKFIKTIASRVSAQHNSHRPALAGVYITPTHFEATDSFKAVSIRNKFSDVDNNEYPSRLKHELTHENIMISNQDIAMIPFKPSKKYRLLDNRAALVSTAEVSGVAIEVVHANNTKVRITTATMNSKFPNIKSFIAPYEDRIWYAACWINAQYMIDVLTVMRDAGYNNVIISLSPNKPVFIEPYDKVTGDDSIGLVMGLKM